MKVKITNHDLSEQILDIKSYKVILSDHDTPIHEYNITPRLYNLLQKNGIHTFAQLINVSDDQLKKMYLMGNKSMLEIQELKKLHLS